MAKTKISEFSSTPANNTDIDSINIAEGCAPSGINDAIRELMAQLKDFQTGAAGDSFNGPVGTTTAAAGAFTTLTASSTATLNTLASSGATLTGGSINNMTIGGTTAAAVSATTLTTSGAVTLNGGTANGVPYLNGSKVLTTGSALTFNGVGVGINTTASNIQLATTVNTNQAYISLADADGRTAVFRGPNSGAPNCAQIGTTTNHDTAFLYGGSEQMRLTSTGLGIGTSSPGAKLDVNGEVRSRTTAGFVINDGSELGALKYSGGLVINRVSGSSLLLQSNNSTQATLDSSGNLGIGTSSPGTKLVVTGAGNITSTISSSSGFAQLSLSGSSGNSSFISYTTTGGGGLGFFDATAVTERARIDSSGNLLVGTTSQIGGAGERVHVRGKLIASNEYCIMTGADTSSGAGYAMRMYSTNAAAVVGSITFTGTATTYNTSSDYRLKNITGPITTSGAYIDSLNPVEGTWKADGSTFVGLIAHEVQEASRTQVATGVKDGEQMQGMDYSSAEIIANLIAEVKALRTRVAALEAA